MERLTPKRNENLFGSFLAATILGLSGTNIAAQESELLALNAESEKSKYKSTLTIPKTKSDYLLKVSEKGQSTYISALQAKVSDLDITQLEAYSAEDPLTYTVVFTKNNGEIYARYDRDGNLISSIERYVNIKIPSTILRDIVIDHPGWSLERNVYSIRYNRNSSTLKNLKVFLQKGKQKKTVNLMLGK